MLSILVNSTKLLCTSTRANAGLAVKSAPIHRAHGLVPRTCPYVDLWRPRSPIRGKWCKATLLSQRSCTTLLCITTRENASLAVKSQLTAACTVQGRPRRVTVRRILTTRTAQRAPAMQGDVVQLIGFYKFALHVEA